MKALMPLKKMQVCMRVFTLLGCLTLYGGPLLTNLGLSFSSDCSPWDLCRFELGSRIAIADCEALASPEPLPCPEPALSALAAAFSLMDMT